MPDLHPLLLGLAQVLACAVPAAGLAWLLRNARCPGGPAGAALCAGVTVGILVGPGVFGRVRPDLHAPVFIGGVAERAAYDKELERQRVERAALEASGVSDVALEEHENNDAAPKRAEARGLLDRARAAHRENLHLAQAALAGVLLVLALPSAGARSGRLWRRTAERAFSTGWRDAGRGALGVVIGASVPTIAAWWLARDWRIALAVGCAMSVPGLASLPCGLFIAGAAGAALASSCLVIMTWNVPITIVGVTALVALALCVGSERVTRAGRRGTTELALAHAVLTPGLTALALAPIDPHAVAASSLFIWLAILAVLWSSDGRWLAWRLTGWTWVMSGRMVSAGASIGQLVFALACGWAGLADAGVAALIIGCLVIELTRGVREALGAQMDAARPP
ncbi:MAG: hypothetical protein ACKVZJ_15630 [Phycisphaerales bacterium]